MGLSIAVLLASHGAILSLADTNEKGLIRAVNSLESPSTQQNGVVGVNGSKLKGGDKQQKPQHIYTRVDVRQSASVNDWIEKTVQTFGRLDGAVNFAGIGTQANVRDETDEGWAFSMEVNARGVFYCIRAQLKHMKEEASIVSLTQAVLTCARARQSDIDSVDDRSLPQVSMAR